MTVQELKDALDELIENDKGGEVVRVNGPGKGWVPVQEIGEYYGEIYLGIPSDLP